MKPLRIRVKIIFRIVCFFAGIITFAFVRTSIITKVSYIGEESGHGSEVSNPVCQRNLAATNEKDCTKNLPELLFVAGIEGSGHHLMSELFDSLAQNVRPIPYYVLRYSPMVNLLDTDDIVNNQKMGFGIIRKRLFRNRLSLLLKKTWEIRKDGGRGVVVVVNSFPMGLSALTTARPDLLVLKYFDCVLYRLKIIVTKRHPLLAVTSTVRRFGKLRFSPYGNKTLNRFHPEDNSYIMQARITEDELIYLDQQVRRFSCNQLHFVSLEKIFSNQTRQTELKSLAKFLKFNIEETSAFLNVTVRAPGTQISLPPDCANCTNKILYEFFEERKDMWPLMV